MDLFITFGIGLLILLARVVDVSIGTLRVISVIDGRLKTAFCLGFLEVLIWIGVISITLDKVRERPILGLFFALGFSLGNVFGILIERRIPLGNLTLRVVGGEELRALADHLRDMGLHATLLKGEGRSGECMMLFSFMPKKYLPKALKLLKPMHDEIFYTLDYGGSSNQILLPKSVLPIGPRRFFKRK